jgi:hypothetical protein
LLNAVIHSHEWATLSATLNLISELTENNSDLLTIADFYVAPIVNADGYQYSFNTVSDLRCYSYIVTDRFILLCRTVRGARIGRLTLEVPVWALIPIATSIFTSMVIITTKYKHHKKYYDLLGFRGRQHRPLLC